MNTETKKKGPPKAKSSPTPSTPLVSEKRASKKTGIPVFGWVLIVLVALGGILALVGSAVGAAYLAYGKITNQDATLAATCQPESPSLGSAQPTKKLTDIASSKLRLRHTAEKLKGNGAKPAYEGDGYYDINIVVQGNPQTREKCVVALVTISNETMFVKRQADEMPANDNDPIVFRAVGIVGIGPPHYLVVKDRETDRVICRSEVKLR